MFTYYDKSNSESKKSENRKLIEILNLLIGRVNAKGLRSQKIEN